MRATRIDGDPRRLLVAAGERSSFLAVDAHAEPDAVVEGLFDQDAVVPGGFGLDDEVVVVARTMEEGSPLGVRREEAGTISATAEG